MRNTIHLLSFLILFILLLNCEKDNSLETETMKLAEGTWHGNYANSKVVFTIIEGL